MVVLNLEERFWLLENVSTLTNSNTELFVDASSVLDAIQLDKELALDPNANWGFDRGRITWDFAWEKENVAPIKVKIPKSIINALSKRYVRGTANNADRAMVTKLELSLNVGSTQS